MEQKLSRSLELGKERESRIFWVEKALKEVYNKKKLLDYEKFSFEISARYNVTVEKAREYINIAKKRKGVNNWTENK